MSGRSILNAKNGQIKKKQGMFWFFALVTIVTARYRRSLVLIYLSLLFQLSNILWAKNGFLSIKKPTAVFF